MTARPEIDLGSLSRDEERMGESPSMTALREQLEDSHYEAQQTRMRYEAELRTTLEARQMPDWTLIASFADWSAREALRRDQLERMGWPI